MPARVRRIGFLTNGTPESAGSQIEVFARGLAELGFVEGRDVVIEKRWAEGKLERLPALAAALVLRAQPVDLVFAPSALAAQAVRETGTRIPTVFAFAPDPVAWGFAASLARPGGTMTGLTSTHAELSAKRLELLREAFPSIRRVAVLYFLAGPAAGVAEQLAETERAASLLGLTVTPEEARQAEDFERAFATLRLQRPHALVVIENPLFFTHRVRLTALAAALGVPAIYNSAEYVRAGGLMSFGACYQDLARRAASYAAKILKGASPGDLPIERPTKFELIVNVATARALGLSIPATVLARAELIG